MHDLSDSHTRNTRGTEFIIWENLPQLLTRMIFVYWRKTEQGVLFFSSRMSGKVEER